MDKEPVQDRQEADARLLYRTGWPILPVLPVETRSPKIAHAWSDMDPTDYERIKDILRQNSVHMWHTPFVADRSSKGAPVSERKPTLVIYSDIQKEGQNIENWRQAVRDLRNMLQEQGVDDLAVEITDYRTFEMDKIETDLIMSDETEVLEAWTKLSPQIIQRISGHKYLSVELLHRKCIGAQEDAKATVVICAADANDSRWWNETIPILRNLLPSFLGIELLYLRTIRAVDEFAMDKLGSTDLSELENKALAEMRYSYPDSIHMGASCGRKWKGKEVTHPSREHLAEESGTLGGLIKFKDNAKQFGLSNHHVFFEGQDYDGKQKEQISEQIQPDSALLSAGIPIVSPSNADFDRRLQRLQTETIGAENMCDLLELRNEAGQGYTAARDKVKSLYANRDRLTGFDANVGTVYASSGSRSVRNEAMEGVFWGTWESDWCLIQIHAEKTLEDKTPRLWRTKEPALATVYHSISAFRIYDVIKYGRTTGKTKGTVSAAISFMQRETDPLPNLPKNTEKCHSATLFGQCEPAKRIGQSTEGSEIPARICHAVRSRQEGTHFMKHGDSGCFVLLDTPNETPGKITPIVGLGFGYNELTGTAYMMPFDLVVHDIQDVTGQTVVQPKYDGEATPTPPRATNVA